MKDLYIMQGVSGSGKSFVVEQMTYDTGEEVSVRSTDDLWMEDGEYKFDPQLLGVKHQQNKILVEGDMIKGVQTIFVDNTNTTKKEAQPYIDLAEKYGYTVRVLSVSCELSVAKEANANRKENRRVPEEVMDKQYERMERIF